MVVTSAMKDSKEWHQNEVHTIASVNCDTPAEGACEVTLEDTLAYEHKGITAYQVEVGLLSRSILIQGAAADSEHTDPDPLTCTGVSIYSNDGAPCPDKDLTGYGGHIMIHSDGVGHVEGVELYRKEIKTIESSSCLWFC